MSQELIKKEGYNARVKLTITNEEFENYLNKTYNEEKNNIRLEGFRKGKAPRKLIEKKYGKGVFMEGALNHAYNDNLPKALEEYDLQIVAEPKLDVEEYKEGEDIIINVDLIIRPDFEIGQYKGLNIERVIDVVEEKDIQNELEKRQQQNARFVTIDDRPVKDQDMIKLDFNGKLDGVEFEGGKSEDYPLTVGSHSFIPGFEEQLIGMNIGEEKTIEVTFPEDYHEKSLAGKPVTFDVKINEIKEKELPEIDDEFVKDISEFDTLDQLKESISKELAEVKEKSARVKLENEIVDKIIENSNFDLPKEMIDNQVNYMVSDFERSLSYQGIHLHDYLNFTQQSIDKIKEDMRKEAEARVKSTMVLDKVKELENVGYDDNQLNNEIEQFAKAYNANIEDVKKKLSENDKKYLIDNLIIKNTLNFLVAENEKK